MKELEENALATLISLFPEAEGKIETTNVVTPMTYVRYCGFLHLKLVYQVTEVLS